MGLELTDLLYIQRPPKAGGSPEFTRHKTTLDEVSMYIGANINTEVDEIKADLEQEIIDRGDGDTALDNRITALSRKLTNILDTLYASTMQGVVEYQINTTAWNNYIIGKSTCKNDPDLEDFEKEVCLENNTQTYHTTIAEDAVYPPRKRVYFASGNHTWSDTTEVLISDIIDIEGVESTFDFSTVLENSYLKLSCIYTDASGNEVVDDLKYGFYQVVKADHVPVETSTSNPGEYVYRLTVNYLVGNGKPSVGEKFYIQVARDSVDQFSDDFVQKIGDEMSGPLVIDPPTYNEMALDVRGPSKVAKLEITGYSEDKVGNVGLSDLVFSDPTQSDSLYLTRGVVNITYSSPVITKYREYDPADPDNDGLVATSTIFSYLPREWDSDANDWTQNGKNRYAITPETYFMDLVLYNSMPNLLLAENSMPNVIPPKGYVDVKDAELQLAIDDINNRVDTLANLTGVFRFRRLPEGETQACHDAAGPNADTDGETWAQCVNTLLEASTAAGNMAEFDWRTFVQDYTNTDGDPDQRNVDVMCFTMEGENADPNSSGGIVQIQWTDLVRVGDYLELASLDIRNEAYVIYRVVEINGIGGAGNAKITGVPLSRSGQVVSGFNYRLKVYDKTSGLTMDDVNDVFVRKDGDRMTGSLSWKPDDIVTEVDMVYGVTPTDDTARTFAITNQGSARMKSLDIYGYNDPTAFMMLDDTGFTFNQNTVNYVRLATNGKLHFTQDSMSPQVFLKIDTIENRIDLTNQLQIKNLMDPTAQQDAVTRGWYGTHIKTANKHIEVTTESDDSVRLKFKPHTLGELSNVDTNGAQQDYVLLYDRANSTWKPSTEAFKVFHPGEQVATTTPSKTERYGFYYESGLLMFKVSN